MRPYRATLAALFGVLACSAAQSALAGGGYVMTAGTVVYSSSNPQLSVFAVVQVGGNPVVGVVQASNNNIAAIGQVGATTSASVGQTAGPGGHNTAIINSAAGPGLTAFFGSNQVAIIGQ
jgi:hypothetical protein